MKRTKVFSWCLGIFILCIAIAIKFFGIFMYNNRLVVCASEYDEADYRSAFVSCNEACTFGEGVACTIVGLVYENGYGLKQNYVQARIFYGKACNLNECLGCQSLGLLYENGYGVKQDHQQAKKYYEKACNLNESEGCNKYRQINE